MGNFDNEIFKALSLLEELDEKKIIIILLIILVKDRWLQIQL